VIIVIRNPLVTDEFEKSIVRVYMVMQGRRSIAFRYGQNSSVYINCSCVHKCRRRCPNRVLITGVQY